VVCGHIHHAELRDIDGILYANDGDWVESLTALGRARRRTSGDHGLAAVEKAAVFSARPDERRGPGGVTSADPTPHLPHLRKTPLPPGFHRLIGAQFASALADNAVLLVALAFLVQQGHPAWWAPLLKFSFTLAYVVLAPVAGPVADGIPKARLMGWMNATKFLGVLLLCLGLHPLLAFAIIGLGAAGYAPAKYGLMTELVGPELLVRANAWIEVSVVAAVLIGAAVGGVLISETLLNWPPFANLVQTLHSPLWAEGSSLGPSFALVLALYLAAGALNVGLPDSGCRYARTPADPKAVWLGFVQALRTLWRDRDGGGLSLGVTTVFWGVGAVLQFAVLRHATEVLGLSLAQASGLQVATAVGVVAGAVMAARLVPLSLVPRLIPLGALFGLLIAFGGWTSSVGATLVVMVFVGLVGGLLVVPMNALLQHRGYQLLTAGRSIAVQGFNENASILVMLAMYALAVGHDLSAQTILLTLGVVLAIGMVLLWARQPRHPPVMDASRARHRVARP
jgi:MFS transporter, LPLT family, lysophospholipid transporter